MRAVKVRGLGKGEVKELRRLARKAKSSQQMRWAQIILARGTRGLKPGESGELFGCCLSTVANVINRWNRKGMKMFEPPVLMGRPPTFTEDERKGIIALAKAPPQAAGKPWNQWSLHKLKDAASGMGIVAKVSHETIRKWLLSAGITPQRMKTWKHSDDPKYAVKKSV